MEFFFLWFVLRTSHQIVFLHCTEIDSRFCTEGDYAFFGKFREGQSSIGIGDAFVQVGEG